MNHPVYLEMTDDEFAAIKARHAASTPGPWDWFGSTDADTVDLATTHSGREWIISFRRYGMRSAGPVFRGQFRRFTIPEGRSPVREVLKRHVRYEVLGYRTRAEAGIAPDADRSNSRLYREDWRGIDHPDADLIAHAPVDIGMLLAEVERLRALPPSSPSSPSSATTSASTSPAPATSP
jgi:hypothetical protein